MKRRPSNILLLIVAGVTLILLFYVLSGVLVEVRQEVQDTPEITPSEEPELTPDIQQ